MQQHSAQHLITAVCENMFDAKTVAWGSLPGLLNTALADQGCLTAWRSRGLRRSIWESVPCPQSSLSNLSWQSMTKSGI